MSEAIRLFPARSAVGPWNMAADEVLLREAGGGRAGLRFYGWTDPTVSLGYFQPAAVRQADPAIAELSFVRRPTGGATLVHHHEITYALALPAGAPWQQRGESWICRFHHLIRVALKELAVSAQVIGSEQEQKFGPTLCFQHQTAGDLLVSGHKVVGSAQRKQRGALLQHGGILMRRSLHAPVLAGITELATIQEERLRKLPPMIVKQLVAETGWHVEPSEWTPQLEEQITELAAEKYAQPWWNEMR